MFADDAVMQTFAKPWCKLSSEADSQFLQNDLGILSNWSQDCLLCSDLMHILGKCFLRASGAT